MSLVSSEATRREGYWGAAILAVLTIALSFVAPAASAQPTNQLAEIEKSLVVVSVTWAGYVQYPTEDGGLAWSDPAVQTSSLCTGWFASESGHVVTAGHCVDPAEGRLSILDQFLYEVDALDLLPSAMANWKVEAQGEGSEPDRLVEVAQPEEVEGAVVTAPTVARVLDYQPFKEGDVALLKVDGLSNPTTPLPVAKSAPEIGDPLTAIGFPGSVAQVSDESRVRASFKSGTASSQQVSPDGVVGTEVNADISPGMSGGPTVNGQGGVLGVNSFTVVDETRNFNFITDAGALRDYLERQNVELATVNASDGATASRGAPTRASDDGFPVGALVAIGAMVVLLAAAVGIAAHLLRKRKPSPVVAATQQLPLPPVPECDHQGNPAEAQFCQRCGSRLQS